MTEAEKVALVQSLIDDASITADQISAYLALAASRIRFAVYPFGGPSELPSEYDNPQCELAVRMIARRGGEGEISHGENGVSRVWASADDIDILSKLVPHVGVL